MIAEYSGLDLVKNCEEIANRYNDDKEDIDKSPNPTNILFRINDLRQIDSHRGNDIKSILRKMGKNPDSFNSGYGLFLDEIYDSIGEALEEISNKLKSSYDN